MEGNTICVQPANLVTDRHNQSVRNDDSANVAARGGGWNLIAQQPADKQPGGEHLTQIHLTTKTPDSPTT